MANHKSAKKAHLTSLDNRARNKSVLSRIKTFITKVENLITSNDSKEAELALRNAESEIMKSVTKGVLKLNTAARKVSKLTKRVKSMSQAA
ncbi:30S ribosomal protein S20p [endosymbiont of Acanthamoeba sp. UWC8]|uniref:30S ribosomal protein S20 n=1 Tax=endosymbiont of Acanthamoeba sp. UWC8 TaxID=86106 RepID=UPI0004D1C8C2|nr:30S ribosomal protein S20 [endosymbiont of Acanthamoeba sp. UWC8]AIF80611.1 30S ribosomal protein S20p [endosymbiont of Acanthamoeba sp. UWC8]